MKCVLEMRALDTRSQYRSDAFGDLLRELTFDFFGSGRHKITMNELLVQDNAVLLDVRSAEEVQTLALPFSHDVTSLHIPTTDIPDRMGEIPRERPVVVFCSAGIRAAIVYAYLRTMGFERVRILLGGYPDITEQARPARLWKRLNAGGKAP